jgi:hypothetical protein
MTSFLVRGKSKFFPISRRSESVKIQEGMAIQYSVRDANNPLQAKQSFFVEFVSTQQIGLIAKIAQEPTQPPECFGCAVNPPSEEMAAVLFRLEHGQSQEIEGSGGVPTIEHPIHMDEEDSFELIGAIFAFAM